MHLILGLRIKLAMLLVTEIIIISLYYFFWAGETWEPCPNLTELKQMKNKWIQNGKKKTEKWVLVIEADKNIINNPSKVNLCWKVEIIANDMVPLHIM